jgi:hypothetical protein
MDYLSAVLIIGYTLIAAIIRTLELQFMAVRMMIAVPITVFVCGHVVYLNFYKFDYGECFEYLCVVYYLVLFHASRF